MTHFNPRCLAMLAAFGSVIPQAHAQINCANPAFIGSGDQEYGSAIAPNELADACGTVGVGYYSLANDTGSLNSAFGTNVMFSNTSGATNSAFGANSLYANTSGSNNTAFGSTALFSNTIGKGNAAQGVNSLYSNTTGLRNVGIGNNALYANTTGSYNIGVGFEGGYNVTSGSNNIEIGAPGTADDNGTIQIGVQGTQTKTTIAGIYGTLVAGSAVYVNANGQLGTQGSSERFKTDIAAMPDVSGKLEQLRPVTFRYKADPDGARQYGLIAEEVAKVYPELVIRDGSGRIQGVHYEELAPILLREVQRQSAEMRALERQVAQLNDLNREMRAGLRHRQDSQGPTPGQ